MAAGSRIAVALEERSLIENVERWLARYEIFPVARGRHFASDLAAAKPDMIVLEAVHPSEAFWLASWLRTQRALSRMPLLMILPFGPAPQASLKGVRYTLKPVKGPRLASEVGRLLRSSYCKPK
jgi:hypothetical protein